MKGIYIENSLIFYYHVSQLYKNSGENLHTLTRAFKYMNILQHKLIVNSFLILPLIWMLHSRIMEHRLNRIHERTVRLLYPNQNQLIFKGLLGKKTRPSAYTRQI